MMSRWFSKELGDAIAAYTPSNQIKEAFLPLFTASGNPLEMAVFIRNDSEGRLHCEVTAYFSPAAVEIAQVFDAEPCERPPRDRLDLLVGDQGCWSVLFPEGADQNE
jgi:hypothetical protein